MAPISAIPSWRPRSLLGRVVIPSRLALVRRGDDDLAYNPSLNIWHRVSEVEAELLRWLRAGRQREGFAEHFTQRFQSSAIESTKRIDESVNSLILRRLLYLDQDQAVPPIRQSEQPLTTVYWICTQACNLSCTYCYQDAQSHTRQNELTTEEGRALIDQAVAAGATKFIFTGGEPFVRRDLLELASYSRAKGLHTNVITNGHYIKPHNLEKVALAFNEVSVSLDHGVAEHHDRHRGSGSWARALQAIDLLISAGVRVDLNSVLSHRGLPDVVELLKLRHQRPIGLHRIVPQFPMGRGGSRDNDELMPDELIALDETLARTSDTIASYVEGNIVNAGGVESKSKKGIRRNHCGAALSEVSVDPEGWVYPCRLLQYSQHRTGNVRNQSLADIYHNSTALRQTRARDVSALSTCSNCLIRHHCGGGCRGIHVSMSGEYSRSDPLFCAYLRRTFEVEAWRSTGIIPAERRTAFHQEGLRYIPVVSV